MDCTDLNWDCYTFSSYCKLGYTFSNGVPVDTTCAYTCRTCQSKQQISAFWKKKFKLAKLNPTGKAVTCSNNAAICENGATCVNKTLPLAANEWMGLTCSCKTGSSGDFCENGNINI